MAYKRSGDPPWLTTEGSQKPACKSICNYVEWNSYPLTCFTDNFVYCSCKDDFPARLMACFQCQVADGGDVDNLSVVWGAFVESCREQDVPLPAADDTLIISVSQTQTSYTSATPTSIPMTSPSTMALTEISSTSAQTDAAASSTTPTAASQTSQLGSTASHSSSNIPAIIGGVIGGATFVVILLLLWFCLRRRQRQKELEEGTNQRRVQLEPSPEVPTPWSYPEAGEMTPWQPQMAQIPSPSPDVHSSLFQSSVPLPDTSVITEASPHSPPLNERYSLITDASGRGQSATATTELGSSQKQRPEEAPSQSGRSDVLSENDVDRIAARLAGYMGSRIVPEDVAGAEAPPSYLG